MESPAHPVRSSFPWLLVATIGSFLLAILAFLNALSLTVDTYDHNESIYLVAGGLIAEGKTLYTDFSFWQMPLSAYLYGAVFALFEPENHLLTGKIICAIFLLVAMISLATLVRQLRGPWWLAGCAVTAALLCPSMVRGAVEASNYIIPVAFSLLAINSLVHAGQAKRPWLWCMLSGFLFALAVDTKLYYLPALLGLALAACFFRIKGSWWQRFRKRLVPLGAGAALAFAPILIFILRDPEVFFFNNLGAHRLTTAWWRDIAAISEQAGIQHNLRISLSQKIGFLGDSLFQFGNLAVLAAVVACYSLLRSNREARLDGLALGLLAMVALSFLAILAPTPMWYQYLTMPMSFAIVLLLVLLTRLAAHAPGRAAVVTVAWMAIASIQMAPSAPRSIAKLSTPEKWVSITIPRTARSIAEEVPRTRNPEEPERLLALQQLHALESDRWEIYPEFAYAPFTFVISDRVPPEVRKANRLVGPGDLANFLEFREPAAVLTGIYDIGFYRDIPLDQWVQEKGWQPVQTDTGLRLHVPPDGPKLTRTAEPEE